MHWCEQLRLRPSRWYVIDLAARLLIDNVVGHF
jgi:hypothetical protein